MPKSKQIKKRGRKPNKIVLSLREAIETQDALNARMKAVLDNVAEMPSHDAMNLAQTFIETARGRKVKKTVTELAEMLDATLRVRCSNAELRGVAKGSDDALAASEREIVTGFVNLMRHKVIGTMPQGFSGTTVRAVINALVKAGYGDTKKTTQAAPARWVHLDTRVIDDAMKAVGQQV